MTNTDTVERLRELNADYLYAVQMHRDNPGDTSKAHLDRACDRLRKAFFENSDALLDAVEALEGVRALIAEGVAEGFNPHAGDWAERLFDSQADTRRALAKLKGEG